MGNGIPEGGSDLRVGEFLVQNKIITQDQLNAALDEQSGTVKKLGEILHQAKEKIFAA